MIKEGLYFGAIPIYEEATVDKEIINFLSSDEGEQFLRSLNGDNVTQSLDEDDKKEEDKSDDKPQETPTPVNPETVSDAVTISDAVNKSTFSMDGNKLKTKANGTFVTNTK